VFAGAYGLTQAQRVELVPMLARRAQAMHDFLAGQAAAGVQPWLRLWRDGHGAAWRADAAYLAGHEAAWLAALLSGE
jgi:hypothetical protein